ncbi:MAG: hypothetical protein OXH50_08730 [Gemmatimonadetes bacterium]|nr:hypothetical protein [Gemmatimonadota bacterium]
MGSSKRNQETSQPAQESRSPTREGEFLGQAAAAAVSNLIGIGCQSGDTVMGLSAVRRVRKLAYLFASPDLAAGTWKELGRRRRSGTRLFRVADLPRLTAAAGRGDLSVVGVKPGGLAAGIAERLEALEKKEEESVPPERSPGSKPS